MIELVYSIKFCLLLVFLIGLITGFLYIRRLIREDYLPIEKKLKDSYKENIKQIETINNELEKNNKEIAQIREDIKRYKDSANVVNEDLLNVEHLYSKESSKNEELQKSIEKYKKIERSLQKEYDYYYNIVLKKDKILKEDIDTKEQIIDLNKTNSIMRDNISKIKNELDEKKNLIKNLEESLIKKESLLQKSELELSEKKNKIFSQESVKLGMRVDELSSELHRYKKKLIEIKKSIAR